ncbi:MAG TPA: hypothetical protein VHD56_16035 [Tepidisphaeraceae bacterium]|nr:hypothetical protein [Tepidisphaeraceae bacterium]
MEVRQGWIKWGAVAAAVGILIAISFLFRHRQVPPQSITPVETPARPASSPLPIAQSDTEQKALVESLLAQGNYEQALVEAKSYYNIVPLKRTSDAVKLISVALTKAKGKSDPSAGSRFIEEQKSGALNRSSIPSTLPKNGPTANLLGSVSIDSHRYDQSIQQLKGSTTFKELMALGDLLLLAGDPSEAKQAFINAYNVPKTKDVHLFEAIEGIARAIRAENGLTGPANALLVDLMLGLQRKDEIPDISAEHWDHGDMQLAGQRVTLGQLSENLLSEQADDKDANSAEVDKLAKPDGDIANLETLALDDPLVIASIVSERDQEIVSWLNDAQKTFKAQLPVAHAEQVHLKSILERTKLPSLVLLQIAHAFQFRSIELNRSTISLFYAAAAKRFEEELKDYGHSPQAVVVLRGMKDHMGGYKSVLWPLINAGDKDATDTLLTIYTNYAQWLPPNDKSLLKPLIHVKIGAAECLYKQRQYPRAWALLQTLDPSKMDKGESQVFHWASGMVLSGLRRYPEALTHLEITSKDRNYQYCRDACKLRFNALLELGRSDEAQEASAAYAKLYGDDKISQYMTAALDRARIVKLQRGSATVRPQIR